MSYQEYWDQKEKNSYRNYSKKNLIEMLISEKEKSKKFQERLGRLEEELVNLKNEVAEAPPENDICLSEAQEL
jgi:hypothetical protein